MAEWSPFKLKMFASLEERVAELAAFLDPIAFEHADDLALRKRRRAALREAANRIAGAGGR